MRCKTRGIFECGTHALLRLSKMLVLITQSMRVFSLKDFEGKEVIITLTYVIVVCTIIYQGLTVGSVMKLYQDHQNKSKRTSTANNQQKSRYD